MTDVAQWAALVGFILPLVVAIVQQSHWSRTVRTVIGAICVVVAAVVTALVEDKFNMHQWATSLIFIALTAYSSYTHIWVPIGAAPWIQNHILATNPKPTPNV